MWLAYRSARCAFTIIELLVVISIVTLLVSLTLPAISKARRSGQALACAAVLRGVGNMGASYLNDHRDVLFGFSYRGRSTTLPNDLDQDLHFDFSVAFNDNAAHVVEARQLFRDVGDDPLLQAGSTGWVPSVVHGNLALAKHQGIALPSKVFLCPGDATKLRWLNKADFEAELPNLASLGAPTFARRARLRPSYYRTISAWHPDIGPKDIVPTTQNQFLGATDPDMTIAPRLLGDVSFPSQKVLLFDQQDRHSNRVQMFYAEQEAAQPLLFFDGSVSTRRYRDANKSAVPRLWRSFGPSGGPPRVQISYEPIAALGEAPELRNVTGGGRDVKFWYTHGGLRGVDFGGPNVDTRTWLP